jgi:hypothetical protein
MDLRFVCRSELSSFDSCSGSRCGWIGDAVRAAEELVDAGVAMDDGVGGTTTGVPGWHDFIAVFARGRGPSGLGRGV